MALRAARDSLANSALYRWQLVQELFTPGHARRSRQPLPDNERYDPLAFLPSRAGDSRTVRPRSVAVVIPVYRGLEATRACLESVLRSSCVAVAEVIVVDDASPEEELSAYLDGLAAGGRIRLLRNEHNQGFVASANSGMTAAGALDVVLLNSDTIANGDWVDRLAAAAGDMTVGTVTPFSNNATICSYPTIDGFRQMPDGVTVGELDELFSRTNAGRSSELPTAHGFCMYIKRDCLQEVGLFDTETFERGYGEENEFCLRAAAKGWRHVLAEDTFVWHEGEVSFGTEAMTLRERALEGLTRRYPRYLADVSEHVRRDPARPARLAVTAARFQAGDRPVVLMVTHALGGGTQKHVLDLCRRYEDELRFLVLSATDAGPVRLYSPEPSEAVDIVWSADRSVESLAALVKSFGVDRLHIHHVLGFPFDLRDLMQRLDVPFDVTVHDYYAICPRVRLLRPVLGYCGGPHADTCRRCLAVPPRTSVSTIEQWSRRHSWMLTRAERVICPSLDTARRLREFVAGPEIVLAPHDALDHRQFPPPLPPTLKADEPLRVALLGVLAADKGARVVGRCARLARRRDLPVEFSLVGHVPKMDARLVRGAALHATGPYHPDERPSLLDSVRPHVVWFASMWPETYSYTLSEAMEARLPVLVPDIGAFTERTSGRPWSWRVAWESSAADFLTVFIQIRDELESGAWTAKESIDPGIEHPGDDGFYDRRYLNPFEDVRRPLAATDPPR